jgi:anti-anti-sigma regulatory factor
VVLKINITDLPDEQRWSLQGQLVGQWAAELRLTWREERHEGDARRCIVELIDVTFIDQTGEAVLAEIMSQGAGLVASNVYTKHLLLNLRSELKRTRMKGKQDGGGNHG